MENNTYREPKQHREVWRTVKCGARDQVCTATSGVGGLDAAEPWQQNAELTRIKLDAERTRTNRESPSTFLGMK